MEPLYFLKGVSRRHAGPDSSNILSTHHARPCKHGILHGVGVNEAVTVIEFNFDHNKIVNMFKVVTDDLFCMIGITPTDDEVAADAKPHFVRDMVGKGEVTVSPSNLNLGIVNNIQSRKQNRVAYPLVVDV